MIVAQENLESDRHCQYACGDYVQAHEEPLTSNTNAARSLDCLYLRPTARSQNGHDLLHLQTNKIITRRNITPVSITSSIVKQVHKLAEMERMPKGLKVSNRTGLILFDSASIAGVDIEEVSDDDDDDDTSDEENEETDDIDINELVELTQQSALNTSENEEVEEEADEDSVGEDSVEEEEEEEEASDEDSDDEEIHQPDNNNNNVEEVAEELPPPPALRRSSRAARSTRDAVYSYVQAEEEFKIVEEYSIENAPVISMIMCQINDKVASMNAKDAFSFIQTYSLKAGLKKFGDKGSEAATKEMKQLHDRKVFKPIMSSELTSQERRRAMESLIFLTEKRDGRIKARTCANGSTQRDYIPREDAASPTASTDSVLITGVIEAKQRRDIMTLDIPNAFVQTPIPKGEERIIMKIRGVLVDILCQLAPEEYTSYVIKERKSKLLYLEMHKALYGMLVASLLYYKKFREDISTIGFKINPYDVCVANRVTHTKISIR